MKMTEQSKLSTRFEEALVFATQLHQTQVRKGGDIPYISHLLGVTALVLEDGGDEDEAIAALLHDAVEDQGGAETARRFAAIWGAGCRNCGWVYGTLCGAETALARSQVALSGANAAGFSRGVAGFNGG